MIKQILFLSLFILLPSLSISAQTVITGNVVNTAGEPLIANITVQVKGSASISGFATTDARGNYSLNYTGSADSITITVSGMLIGKHSRVIANRNEKVDFTIEEKALELKEVTVAAPKISLRGDTLNYLVSEFTDQNDRVIGDILKKLPGIEVMPSGRIQYQGRDINNLSFV